MQAEAKGLTLVADVEPHVRVHADPELAASAISNVIDNALKYTDAGQVRVNAAPAVDHVTIHVWDNCQGLSGEELQTIFEPFHRGHSRKPGTGLGLAIARRALEAQGGSIHAESPGDRGCHFWLTLPRAALDS
jgi:signal transduction histidine kinase